MPDAVELFQDQNLQPSEFLQILRPEHLAATDKDALRAILKQQWDELQEEPTDLGAEAFKKWKAYRGYAFERLTFKLLALEDMAPSPAYYAHQKQQENDEPNAQKRRGRPSGGEQIDGSFELDGKYFLLEAKWQEEQMNASDMYAFRGRVDGKLVGTIGVIISVPGFVENAQYALLWGKEINVILVTGEDVALTLERGNSFRVMMRIKLREAARMGRVFYSYAEFLDRRGA